MNNKCGSCGEGRQCGKCCGGACGREIFLTEEEIALLRFFAKSPFLPAVKKFESDEVIIPDILQDSRVLKGLEIKGILSIDTDIPLDGFDYSGYENDYDLGSAALTAMGAEAVESLDIIGIN